MIVTVPAAGLLMLSHTRTAAVGLAVALLLALLSLVVTERRARRALAVVLGGAAVGWLLLGGLVQEWLLRGQDQAELTSLTGRATVWDLVMAKSRPPVSRSWASG